MVQTPKEIAIATVDALDPKVGELVIASALEMARSQQALSVALDARTTQVTVLQFAGAALAANVATAAGAGRLTLIFCLLAAAVFLLGGLLGFLGVRSCSWRAPGLEPSWWSAAKDHPGFDVENAQAWTAGILQEAIDFNRMQDDTRARWLDRSLMSAAGAALLLVCAAGSRLL